MTNQKFDPYINVDPGTMSPYEHGEVFVTDDGAETDLDLGHYERFTDENLTKNSSITMGKIYQEVIERERRGDYLGKTVQVIPHITNAIKEKIYAFEDSDVDIVITEIGGTVGRYRRIVYDRSNQTSWNRKLCRRCYIYSCYTSSIHTWLYELKSKPTQHSAKELQSLGIKPDILVCRTELEIPENLKEKIALFCNVRKESVIANKTAKCLYEVPLMLEEEGLAREVCKHLKLEKCEPNNKSWEKLIDKIHNVSDKEITIAIVGKYIKLEDSYLSVIESLKHAGIENGVTVKPKLIDAEKITESTAKEMLKGCDGIVVPGGFGNRGIEGKIQTIKYARENNVPFLGICLGMQMAVVEFARDALNLKDANSEEFDEICENPVIHIMYDQKDVTKKGGTMRLGSYPCILKKGSIAEKLYKTNEISERHRHRFEYNNDYREEMEKNGLMVSGTSPDGNLVEIVELKNHPYFIACQFHPEFKSRPDRPSPLFAGLVKAAKLVLGTEEKTRLVETK